MKIVKDNKMQSISTPSNQVSADGVQQPKIIFQPQKPVVSQQMTPSTKEKIEEVKKSYDSRIVSLKQEQRVLVEKIKSWQTEHPGQKIKRADPIFKDYV